MEPITVKNGIQIIKFNYDGNGSALAKKPDGSFLKMSAEQLDRALFPPQEIKTPSGAILSIRPRREPIATTDIMNGFKIWAVNIRTPKALRQRVADDYVSHLKSIISILGLYLDEFFIANDEIVEWVGTQLEKNKDFLKHARKTQGNWKSALKCYREYVRYRDSQ